MRTYGQLREKIRNIFGTLGAFATALGMDRSTLSKKINGIVPWDQDEIERCLDLLSIPRCAVADYFFYEE